MGHTSSKPPPYNDNTIIRSVDSITADMNKIIHTKYNMLLNKSLKYINDMISKEALAGSREYHFCLGNITIKDSNTKCVFCCEDAHITVWDTTCPYICWYERGCYNFCVLGNDECLNNVCCCCYCCLITTYKTNTPIVLDFKDKHLEAEYYEKLCNEIIDILQKQKYNASIVNDPSIKIKYDIPGYDYHNVISIKW